ncbi:hypothetical protein LWC34_23920 [Kibdelosporangium philippinense]|uniref:LPXTG-motif cell wall anchor domain-containing protein n=1 Tax=Kibdelosporangium philippinense TaxID=211113 RepID=A0ABS8ZE81_9PSEU|nr:hypothetical protein [Kibdelosporangium philippinense]MCE7005852.1 hypothetical protein [Kibdelosporangium philippinense]
MHKKTFFGTVALGIAGLALAAPMANATTAKGSLGFDHNPAKAGDKISVIGTCDDPKFTTAKVDSTVLEPFEVSLKDDGKGGKALTGATTVKKDAKPGTYPVTYQCGTVRVASKLTIVTDEKTKPTATATKPAPVKPREAQVAVKPKGSANTGDGSEAAAQQDSGSDAGMYVLGGAGLLAAGGAGAYFLRRRSHA